MGRFFLPLPSGPGPSAEQAYSDLREQAEAYTGSPSSNRRIEQIKCRRTGRDYTLKVGEADAIDGRTVAAIIQLQRGTLTVHHLATRPGELTEPTQFERTQIYSITDFY